VQLLAASCCPVDAAEGDVADGKGPLSIRFAIARSKAGVQGRERSMT
jgi:hypothetical protein